MRFHAILAMVFAYITFALANTTLTTTWPSTLTVTRTMMLYNATTTSYYSGTASTAIVATTTPSTVHSPSLTAVATPSTFKGAASNSQANIAVAGLMGLAAFALGSL